MKHNSILIKKYEDAIETTLSTIKYAAEGKGVFGATELILGLDETIKEEDIKNKYPEIYFNLKIAFNKRIRNSFYSYWRSTR